MHSVLPNTKKLDGSILYSHLKAGAFTLGWLLRGPCCWAEAIRGQTSVRILLQGYGGNKESEKGRKGRKWRLHYVGQQMRGGEGNTTDRVLLVYKMGGSVPRESRQTCTSHRNLLTYKTSCGFSNSYFRFHSSAVTFSWE